MPAKTPVQGEETTLLSLKSWVSEVADLMNPKQIQWYGGTQEEYQDLIKTLLDSKGLIELDQERFPQCYLHRSDPQDVARVEHLTFICSENPEDAGVNNNWMNPQEAREKMEALFRDSMQGRVLYVIPYCMGPIDSPYSRVGVEITDSPYVVINMHKMTQAGSVALRRIEQEGSFVKGLHCTGELDPNRRFIMHYPEKQEIHSYGSGYGGNALLGKKCHALRLASFQAKQQGWLAEHMLILGIQNPEGLVRYVAAAFPSACGKTNLAMLTPPESYVKAGWKVWTVGDDIAWIHPGEDGQLWAINPEKGFFGVVPGTTQKTNPVAFDMIQKNTIFTNVAMTQDKAPWWDDLKEGVPAFNWKGEPCTEEVLDSGPAAHPNSRFTVEAKQCAKWTVEAENPKGVPLSAIIFGGRRSTLMPLVLESKDWEHGVLLGASMASQTTAAAALAQGLLRRDPMAMKPFCGYDFGSYFEHWLSFAEKDLKLPKIFHVNWFRRDEQGHFIWPGFGENFRVLEWILKRTEDNKAPAVDTPVGYLPDINKPSLNLEELNLDPAVVEELFHIDNQGFTEDFQDVLSDFERYGSRMPKALKKRVHHIIKELEG